MRPKRKTAVHLTGGLGNQLFQLAAGLHVSGGGDVDLIAQFGLPRRSSVTGRVDIEDFDLPASVRVVNDWGMPPLRRRLVRSAIQYLMASTVRQGTLFSGPWTRSAEITARFLASSRSTGHFAAVVATDGVGFDSRLLKVPPNSLLIGYLQTWRFASGEKVLPLLKAMRPARSSSWIDELRAKAEIEQPVVVHIRLGDYTREPAFGLPGSEYVATALERIRASGHEGRVWLFSDEPEQALKRLPGRQNVRARVVVPPTDVSSAGVLEAMRLGRAYVLANSTFGWWGAFLSHTNTPQVIVPSPWFRAAGQPRDLIPEGWASSCSHFSDPEVGS